MRPDMAEIIRDISRRMKLLVTLCSDLFYVPKTMLGHQTQTAKSPINMRVYIRFYLNTSTAQLLNERAASIK